MNHLVTMELSVPRRDDPKYCLITSKELLFPRTKR